MKYKEGDIVRLKRSCVSGMRPGTIGIVVRNCGHKNGRELHFHKYDRLGADAHMKRAVCNNQWKWELVEMPQFEKAPVRKWWQFWIAKV